MFERLQWRIRQPGSIFLYSERCRWDGGNLMVHLGGTFAAAFRGTTALHWTRAAVHCSRGVVVVIKIRLMSQLELYKTSMGSLLQWAEIEGSTPPPQTAWRKKKKDLFFLKRIYIYIRVFKQVAIKWLPVTLWACVTNDALMAILKIKVNRDPATL
jgi:hypothetical protein